jgi:hypothetical protein
MDCRCGWVVDSLLRVPEVEERCRHSLLKCLYT